MSDCSTFMMFGHWVKGVTASSPHHRDELRRNLCTCATSLQVCLALFDPEDWSPPGSFMHGILQARIRKGVAVPSSRGSSRPRDQKSKTFSSCKNPAPHSLLLTGSVSTDASCLNQQFHCWLEIVSLLSFLLHLLSGFLPPVKKSFPSLTLDEPELFQILECK